jgi:hypothetical protein
MTVYDIENTIAHDPQIQNELQQIQQEFAIAELTDSNHDSLTPPHPKNRR